MSKNSKRRAAERRREAAAAMVQPVDQTTGRGLKYWKRISFGVAIFGVWIYSLGGPLNYFSSSPYILVFAAVVTVAYGLYLLYESKKSPLWYVFAVPVSIMLIGCTAKYAKYAAATARAEAERPDAYKIFSPKVEAEITMQLRKVPNKSSFVVSIHKVDPDTSQQKFYWQIRRILRNAGFFLVVYPFPTVMEGPLAQVQPGISFVLLEGAIWTPEVHEALVRIMTEQGDTNNTFGQMVHDNVKQPRLAIVLRRR